MRKEAQAMQNVTLSRVQGYHQENGYGTSDQSYAFAGFNGNWFFNSDRKYAVHVVNGKLVPVEDKYADIKCQGYGYEIETQCNGVMNTMVLAELFTNVIFPKFKFGKYMFKMQRDGSLGGDSSAEVITQVMTKGRIRNDYAAYKTMYDTYFQPNAFRISADPRTTHCGMHINVSNGIFGDTEAEQIEGIKKLYYVVNRYYALMCKLFNRPDNRTEWCQRMTESHLDCAEGWRCDTHKWRWENARNIPLGIEDAPEDHSNCFNMSHFNAGRIEIRLVGGQDNYIRFRNTSECVFFLTENINRRSWNDLEDLTKIFTGCNQYVVQRLKDCIGRDGFTNEMYEYIKAHAKHEDLELR